MENKETIITVTDKELSLVENNLLNASQLGFLTAATPKKFQLERPGKGGGKWTYVSGAYVKKVLNLIFGWDWDFKVIKYEFDIAIGQAFVQGELTCRIGDKTIVKHQFGRVDIKFKTEWIKQYDEDGEPVIVNGQHKAVKETTNKPLDLGNDLKAATTDALKKCASELGIAADIYSPREFKALKVVEAVEDKDMLEAIKVLFKNHGDMQLEDILNIERIIDQQEEASYNKVYKILTNNQAKK
jgi:hypothetical protein